MGFPFNMTKIIQKERNKLHELVLHKEVNQNQNYVIDP